MDSTALSVTVYFEDPFWVGMFERRFGGKLQVCKITFGAEPKDYEVYEAYLACWKEMRFSPEVKAGKEAEKPMNPKRMQRAVARTLTREVGSKSQQALKLQYEKEMGERRSRRRAGTEEEKQRQWELHLQKKKEKHRGR